MGKVGVLSHDFTTTMWLKGCAEITDRPLLCITLTRNDPSYIAAINLRLTIALCLPGEDGYI